MITTLCFEGSSFNFLTKEDRLETFSCFIALLAFAPPPPIIHTRLTEEALGGVCIGGYIALQGNFLPRLEVRSAINSFCATNIQCISLLIHLILIKASKGLYQVC